MRGLLNATVEDFIRVSVLVCILLNIRFTQKIYYVVKQNRMNIAVLHNCIRAARLTKAIETHNAKEMADTLIDQKIDEL